MATNIVISSKAKEVQLVEGTDAEDISCVSPTMFFIVNFPIVILGSVIGWHPPVAIERNRKHPLEV